MTSFPKTLRAYGSVQGFVHAWHSGAEPPFFQLRELSSGDLVRAEYKPDLHAKIVHAHESEHHTVIHVYGDIRWDRTTRRILEMSAVDIDLTQPLTDAGFNRLIGSMPEFTGDMTTTDYLDWIREDGD